MRTQTHPEDLGADERGPHFDPGSPRAGFGDGPLARLDGRLEPVLAQESLSLGCRHSGRYQRGMFLAELFRLFVVHGPLACFGSVAEGLAGVICGRLQRHEPV
jgi:hypothetical protein